MCLKIAAKILFPCASFPFSVNKITLYSSNNQIQKPPDKTQLKRQEKLLELHLAENHIASKERAKSDQSKFSTQGVWNNKNRFLSHRKSQCGHTITFLKCKITI